MRAVLLDPFTRHIHEIQHDGTSPSIYKSISADCFEVTCIDRESGDVFYVDDEGLFRGEDQRYFTLYDRIFAGKALALGTTKSGGNKGCTLSLTWFRAGIVWVRPDLVFDGMETEESMGTHPLFGDKLIPMIRNIPRFKIKGEKE